MASAVQVQYRRGTSTQVGAFTGAQGELIVDTTNNRVVVQDGATAGGWPAAKLSEVVTNARTQVSDGNYTALATDRTVAYITLTAARAVALPAAASYPTGSRLLVVDESGACSATSTITLNASGADLIDGTASAAINSAYGYLALQSNGLNKWTIVDQVSSPSSSAPSTAGGFLNKFRNGTIDVWQRGTGAITVTTSGAYAADGWIVVPTGASVTVAQASGRLLTKNSMQVTGATSVSDLVIKQRIESLIAAALCSQTVTVQAQVYNGTGGAITPTLTVKHAGSQDVWTSPVTDVSAASLQSCPSSAWTQVAYTFTASSSAYNGIEISFDFGNNLSANTKTIQVTELDIRVTPGATTGLNASPPGPELRPIHSELAFCQRYLFVASNYYVGLTLTAQFLSAGNMIFPVTMRTTPTGSNQSFSAGAGNNGVVANNAVAGSDNADVFTFYNSANNWSTNVGILVSGTYSTEL